MVIYKKSILRFGGYELEKKFKKICSGFKFNKEFLEMNYNTLSGGEKTIVNLAKILLKDPSILLLDEPTNHLDIEMLEWLESFLILYKGTVLLISHDRYFLDKVATKTILLENGKTEIYYGNYSYFLEEDERKTLAEFENYKSQQKKIQKMQESIRKLRAFGTLAGNEMFFKRAKSIEKRLEKLETIEKVDLETLYKQAQEIDPEAAARVSENDRKRITRILEIYHTTGKTKTKVNIKKKKIPINLNISNRPSSEVLVIKKLNKSYDGKNLFKNFNMEIYRGEKVRLNGKNGSRKINFNKNNFRRR